MSADIIAESQTDSVLAALDRGDADDKVRDQVSAALLRAMSKLSTELVDIKSNLWKPDDLRQLIDDRHERKCRDCPAKKMAEERLHLQQAQQAAQAAQAQQAAHASEADAPQNAIQWLIKLMANSSFQFFVLLLFLIGAFVYLTTGKSGVDAARDTMSTVIHGGGAK